MALSRGGTRRRQVAPPSFRSARPSNIALRTRTPRKVRPSRQSSAPSAAYSIGMYPVYSSATVYGMQVGTWIAEGSAAAVAASVSGTPELVATLYHYPDLSTPVATLDYSIERSWQEELSETGSGKLSLLADDPNLASFQDDGDDVIVFTYRDHRAFAMLAEKKNETVISDQEESGEGVVYSGRGLLALFERIVVYPVGGVGRKPIEEDRPFNWTSPSYDDSAWGYAAPLGTLLEMRDVAGFLIGADPGTIDIGLPNLYLTFALWAPGYTFTSAAPLGKCYFRQVFTVPENGPYRVYFGCDDSGTFFINGQEITRVDGVNWFGVSYVDVDLTAGDHLAAAVVENQTNLASIVSGDPGINPGKFVFQVYRRNIVGEALPENMVYTSNANCKVAVYPPEPPGMTVGNVLRLCVEEAQDRGYLTSLVLNFSDTLDSAGRAWPVEADIATKTGTDVLTFMRELTATYCDLWMDTNSMKLWAWTIDPGRGSVKSGVSLRSPTSASNPNSGNLLNYEKESEFMPVGAFLLRWKEGWTERTDAASLAAYGHREALLEIGAPTSIEEINRLADKQFKYFSDPRTSITTKIAPIHNGDDPYLDFMVGDQITTPDGTERVLAITMEENRDIGIIEPTLTLRNIILGAMERAWQALRKVG